MPIEAVSRELLVRYLDTWVPAAMHGTRRATFAQVWQDHADIEGAEASLRVFAEFADRMRGRRLTLLYLATAPGELKDRLDRVQAGLNTPAELAVHVLSGDPSSTLKPALAAAQASGAPLLACVDADELPAMSTFAVGKPTDLLLGTAPGAHVEREAELHAAGFTLVCNVDLVASDAARQLTFATARAKHLEAFKNAVWEVDEYAGVRIRDPHDQEGRLLDISLNPSLGPLRRELAAHLREVGQRSVAQVRQFALTGTVYRASDVNGALAALLTAGAISRDPEHGRLAGDTLVRPAD